MKYYKLNEEVYAFEADGSQDEYITDEMIAMSDEEVEAHLNPVISDEEKRARLPVLTRRQFKLALLENNLLSTIEIAINAIEDNYTRTKMQIEYQEATKFHRTSEAVIYMCNMLGLTDEQVDVMWQEALQN